MRGPGVNSKKMRSGEKNADQISDVRHTRVGSFGKRARDDIDATVPNVRPVLKRDVVQGSQLRGYRGSQKDMEDEAGFPATT